MTQFIKHIFYTNCKDLPLYKFIQCLETGQYKYLARFIIFRFNFKFLFEIFNTIFFEYLDAIKDSRVLQSMSITKEIVLCESKYNLIHTTLQCIVSAKSEHIIVSYIDRFKKMGFRYKFDYSDAEAFSKDIKRIATNLKTLGLRISDLKKDLQNLQNEKNTTKSINGFNTLLAELSKFQGYRLNAKEISVLEFSAILTRYKDFVEASNNKNKPEKSKF